VSLSAEIFGSDSWIFKLGNTLGLGIPSWANETFSGAPDPQYNKLGDIGDQTAEEGVPRPIVWGRVRPIGGALIYVQRPQLVNVLSYAEVEGGSGNSEQQEIVTQHVYRTYAIGVCEGPITKFVRVWRNGKKVYDARGTAWGDRNNPTFLARHKLFLGGWDQEPSPHLQAILGTDIPAFRGTAYVVCVHHDLTGLGGAVPQYQFEVERAEGEYLTSRPYPAQSIDGFDSLEMSATVPPYVAPDFIDTGAMELLSGTLRNPMIDYDAWPAEAVDAGAAQLLSGVLRPTLIEYTDGAPEAVDAGAAELLSGGLREALSS